MADASLRDMILDAGTGIESPEALLPRPAALPPLPPIGAAEASVSVRGPSAVAGGEDVPVFEGAAVAEGPRYTGPTWEQIKATPEYQQGSSEKKRAIEEKFLEGVNKWASTALTKKADQQIFSQGLLDGVPLTKAPKATWGDRISDLWQDIAVGAEQLVGSLGSITQPTNQLPSPEASFLEDFFNPVRRNEAAAERRLRYSDARKDAEKILAEHTAEAAPGEWSQFTTTLGTYREHPSLAFGQFAQQIPNILSIFAGGALARGGAAALGFGTRAIRAAQAAGPLTPELAAAAEAAPLGAAARGAAAATSGALGAGQARQQVAQSLGDLTEQQWMTDDEYRKLRLQMGPEKAKQKIIEDRSLTAGVVGLGLGIVAGLTGVERILGPGAGKALKSRAGRVASEILGEEVEEITPQVLANVEKKRFAPETSLVEQVGQTAAQTLAATGPSAAVAGIHPVRPEPGERAPTPPARPEAGVPEGAPTPPPAGPVTFLQGVETQREVARDQIRRIEANNLLTPQAKEQALKTWNDRLTRWDAVEEEYRSTPVFKDAQARLEQNLKDQERISAQEHLDERAKAQRLRALTEDQATLERQIAYNELDEHELQEALKQNSEALMDFDVGRGRARADQGTITRLTEDRNFITKLLEERALIETPAEVEFAARAPQAFEKDASGNFVYPGIREIGEKPARDALNTLSDIAQSRIYHPRTNSKYTRAQKAELIRKARQLADATDRALAIMDMQAEQLTPERDRIIQAVVDLARKGTVDQGLIRQNAAVLARQAELRGEQLTWADAQQRSVQEIAGLIRETEEPGGPPVGPPPAGAPDPAPAPGTDPGQGGTKEGYDNVDGWLFYNSKVGITDGFETVGKALSKDDRTKLTELLGKTFGAAKQFSVKAVQFLNLRWVNNTSFGALGWYYPSRGQPWKVASIATDLKNSGKDPLHTTAHEVGHAFDDVLRDGDYMSVRTKAFQPGSKLRAELENAHRNKELNLAYPLDFGSGGRERIIQIELFAQVMGYYHSNPQNLAKAAPTAYAMAEEIVNGINGLESSGQLGQPAVADVVSAAMARAGGTPYTPAGTPAPGAAAPANLGPAGERAGPGVAEVPGAGRADVLTETQNAIESELDRQTALLGDERAIARQEQILRDEISATEAEISAQQATREPAARPAGVAERAQPRTGERAPETRAAQRGEPATRARPAEAARPGPKAEKLGIASRYGVKTSSATKVRNALARIFGVRPDQVARILPNVEIVPLSAVDFVTDESDPTSFTGSIRLNDGTRLTGLNDTVGAFYDPKSNRIAIIADNIVDGSERSVIYHELFHKRGGQLLGRKTLQRFRDEVKKWGDKAEGTPEREIYDRAMPRVRAALRGLKGQNIETTLDEELLPYFIEEAVNAGYKLDLKKALGTGVDGWLNRVGVAFRNAIAKAFGKAPKEFTLDDLLAAAYGSAQLELPGTRGASRAARILEGRTSFGERVGEIQREGVEYIPEKATPKERTRALRPSQVFRSEMPQSVNPIYGTRSEISAANRAAPAPGPGQNASHSIYERFKPVKAAPVKTRSDVKRWAQTQQLPTAEWAPQFRDTFIENWVDHQRPFYNWLRDNVLSMKAWRELKLVPGKMRHFSDRITSKLVDPIAQAANDFARKHKISPAEASEAIGQWTTMRHVPEANAALREKIRRDIGRGDPSAVTRLRQFDETQRGLHPEDNDPDRGRMAGGYSDEEAKQIQAQIEARYGRADLERVGDMIVDGFATMKQEALNSGQLSPEAVKNFPNFKHYVALTGTPWDDSASDAFGSYIAPNILKERGGMQNHVADQALVALMDRIGRVGAYTSSKDFKGAVNELWEQNGGDKNTIGIEKLSSENAQSPFDSDVIWQDPKGKRWIFRFTGPAQGVGQAILSKNREYADNLVLNLMNRATRLFSRAVTQWTLTFAPINMLRDVQEKSILLRSRNVTDATGQPVNVNKMLSRTWANALSPELWRAARDLAFKGEADNNTYAGRLANELVENGGLSTWGQIMRRGREAINKEIARKGGVLKRIESLDRFVANYNMMFEVVSSLSTHAAQRELGVAPKEAAFNTLELMNFQNMGAKTAWLRTMYSFFNPAMQSGRNFFSQISTKRGATDALALMFLSAGLYAMARAVSGDDDELGSKLDQRGSFEIERNIPISIGDATIKIPVGFGLAQFVWANTVNAMRVFSGRYDFLSAVAQSGTSFLKTFSPIPPSEIEFTKQPNNFLLKSATPTVFRPVVDLATDTNAWGQKLTAYYPDKTKFAAQQGAPSTPVVYKNLADEMRRITGIDAYPEQWRTFVEGSPLGWGPLGYVLKSVAQSNAEMEGRRKDPIDEIPGSTVWRLLGGSRVVGGTSRYLEARYHEQYDKSLSDLREYSLQKQAGRGDRWLQANPERARRIDAIKAQEREMRSISKEYNALLRGMQAGTISLERGQRQLEGVANHRERQMRDFLKLVHAWNEDELGEPEEVGQ